jgi:2-oxoglutarate ferredoxin oxidoreductase subunit delta
VSQTDAGAPARAGRGPGPASADRASSERVVALDLDLCKACGICIALCPARVFDADELGNPVVARPDDCTSCLLCEFHCPDFAIEVARPVRKKRAKAETEPAEVDGDVVYSALATARDEDGHEMHGGHDEDG